MPAEPLLSGIAPVPSHVADVAAADYLQTRGWLYADRFDIGRVGSATFADEATLWAAALAGQGFYETRRLTLEDVVLTDWVPRSPGRYYTPEAKAARDEARYRILERKGDAIVYDASGKTSMVQGGIGCLRLAMKDIGGEQVKFLGATTSGIAHRSFVVALDRDLYALIAERIDKQGGVRCTILGTVRSWTAGHELDLFMSADVPRVYLGVEEVRLGTLAPDELPTLDVTPAVTFEADGATYFAYTHFEPSDVADITRAVEWMGGYVSDRYHGRVTTDFDELITHFADTAAPLRSLMDPQVRFEQLAASLASQISGRALTVITTNIGEVVMGDKYEINQSQVGAVGQNARAQDNIFVQGAHEFDVQVLAEELGQLHVALRERGTGAEEGVAVDEVAAAEMAAKEGDAEGALRHLRRAGQWALGVATEIGVPVATAALKSVVD